MKQMKTLTVNGVTYAVTDPEAARIDESTVGDAPWSAKKLIDTLAPAFRRTGNPVVCRPVAGYPLTVESQGTVTRCGKNLCSIGTASFTREKRCENAVELPAGSYRLSYAVETTDTDSEFTAILFEDAGGNAHTSYFKDKHKGRHSYLITLEAPAKYIHLYASASWSQSEGDTATFSDIQIEAAETSTPYEPYKSAGTFEAGVEIPALAGVNTLWSDGELTVTGRADPAAILESLGGMDNVV